MVSAPHTTRPASSPRPRRRMWAGSVAALTARQVNLVLGAATFGAVVTGLVSWAVGTGWSRWWTALHAVCGVTVLVLAPAKTRRSVRTGIRRRRPTRWLSIAFGVLVLATVVVGFAHSTGIWTGVGLWSSLWTHVLLAFVSVPLFIWHLVARPARPRGVDVNRRLLIGAGTAVAASAVVTAAVEAAVHVGRAPGRDRRSTGSYEVGSFDPDVMPTVSWLDDTAPATSTDDWELRIGGSIVTLGDLRLRCRPVVVALDCTGGWWSEQRWDAISIRNLLPTDAASVEVTSATGYSRILPMSDADDVYLALGYDGRPLRLGHGAPARLVAPGRRGPWWVKWVVSIEPTDRPWWLQAPFPLT